jgi:hypothetical protein
MQNLWDSIDTLMALKPETPWEAAYVAEALDEDIETVKDVMDQMDHKRELEERICEIFKHSGVYGWDLHDLAFVLGEDRAAVDVVLLEMEECGTAVKEELEPEDMTNELKEALDDQKRNHTVFVEVEEEVAV